MTGKPKYRKLKAADRAKLAEWRLLGEHVIQYYLGKPAQPLPATLEKVCAAWRADRRDKVRPPDFACAFGTLLGDRLVDRLDFEWSIISDEQGEDFCLRSAASGWETYPIDYVWKRVKPRAPREDGFLKDAVRFWRGKVPARKSPAA